MFIMQISIVILDRHYLKNIKKGTIDVISKDHPFIELHIRIDYHTVRVRPFSDEI